MDVEDWVRSRNGVTRVVDARAAGFSDHTIRRAVAGRALVRPRGGWVAVPDADAALIAAARAGVVLTCITLAARLGVWVHEIDIPHLAAPATSGSVTARNAHIHWAKPLVLRVPGALVDGVENMLVILAACQNFERARASWESAMRKGLVQLEQMRRLPLAGAARAIAAVATPFVDSGLETYVLVRLQWLGVPIVPQVFIAGRRVDFLIGQRLVLQIDGGHHVGAQRAADIAHDAPLMTLGYHVIRVGYTQVVERWHEVQHLIMVAVAQGLHRAS